jgi:hypothetical protein
MKRPSRYKVTFFDRHGPAAEHLLKAYSYGFMVFGITVGATFLTSAIGGINPFKLDFLLVTLGVAVTLSAVTIVGSLKLGTMVGDGARYLTAGGSGTPYDEVFSQEQALVMQRDYATALHLFEQRIIASPNEPRVLVAAADLYMTHGENPKRAAELYKEVQRVPNVSTGHDIYASNKLADLYLGPLNERGKALVELRRLIERYPGSTVADHARLGLTNLKEDMLKDHESS